MNVSSVALVAITGCFCAFVLIFPALNHKDSKVSELAFKIETLYNGVRDVGIPSLGTLPNRCLGSRKIKLWYPAEQMFMEV